MALLLLLHRPTRYKIKNRAFKIQSKCEHNTSFLMLLCFFWNLYLELVSVLP